MAFFKFRKGGEDQSGPTPAPESVEAMRKRAKHRLIGASLLVLIGVVGFPLLFDNQPRPIPVDLPIDIPDKNKVKPLGNLPVGGGMGGAGDMIEESLSSRPAKASPSAASAAAPVSSPASGAVAAVAPPKGEKLLPKPLDKALLPKPEVLKPEPEKADAAKALALLEGKESLAPAPGTARFVVQVGAFSDAVKAREARVKLEAAGLRTYTQVVNPKEGKRIRVRIGPFESKALADTAASKIKKLDLPAAVLEL